jgi:lipopolysaccharide export LptBFGC system permease protein LptF
MCLSAFVPFFSFPVTIVSPSMSKTLFWYLFRDLIRIFLVASGTLAGIMSFGGLLRPLTENGLDAGQVGKLLTYLTPAMMAYSLPAAALFATTVTYGRLAADNELTACRAAGMSYTAIGLPAVVLGLLVAIFSLLLLCFLVPTYSLKAEKVIFSNMGQVVVNKIRRDHQIRFSFDKPTTVYAEDATMPPPDPAHPADQIVQLRGPTVVNSDAVEKDSDLRVPKDFFTAESATLVIHPSDNGQVRIDIELKGGAKFPRQFGGAERNQVGVESVRPAPMFQPSPIKANVKFMDAPSLMRLAGDPSESDRVVAVVDDLRRQDEERAYLRRLAADPTGTMYIRTGGSLPQTYILSAGGPPPVIKSGKREDELTISSEPKKRQVGLTVIQGEQTTRTAQAATAIVRAHAVDDDENKLISVSIELHDVTMRTSDLGLNAAPAEIPDWGATLDVAMDEGILQLRESRTLAAYAADSELNPDDANHLRREQIIVNNDARAELQGRASFSVSCLILVLVGCALGMMFKSGNFLTAFAVSFAPALLCIALVVAGEQTANHIPVRVGINFIEHNRPLQLGVGLIWSGNAIVLVLAGSLVARLRRR